VTSANDPSREMKTMPPLEPMTARAIEAGIGFLARTQAASGEIPIFISQRRDMAGPLHPDPCVFPTALAAYALGFVPGAGALLERAIGYLMEQRSRRGVWHHWRRDHSHFTTLPPDLDDTACASAILTRHGVSGAAERRILLDNRNRHGLFYTWLLPRLRWTSAPHRRVMLDQLRLILAQGPFFRGMTAKADDVDAVVNANCLYALGSFPGDTRVIEHLLGVLRTGNESRCDKWYDDPFAVWYFLSRVLCDRVPEAADLIARRIATTAPESALDLALGIAALISCKRRPPEAWITRLLEAQLASGGWPIAPIYIGGRARRRDGWFEDARADEWVWGSEALTTAFCLQALAQRAAIVF